MKTSLKNIKINFKSKKQKLEKIEEISFLAKNNLSPNEIESFLSLDLLLFNNDYFNKHFKAYSNLTNSLNSLELITYINFNEKLKKDLLTKLLKSFIYPLILFFSAFITLIMFKYSILPLFQSVNNNESFLIVNIVFYISLVIIFISLISITLSVFVFNNPTYYLMFYLRFYKFRIFKLIEYYYIVILSHLLITFDNQGLSTYQTFVLINKFKGNTVIANLAYFVSADLEAGSGLEKSIKNMQINPKLKNVIILGMQTNKYNLLLNQFQNKTLNDIYNEIDKISKLLLITSYIYIGIVVLLLYKILSIPLSIIDTL